MDGRIVFRGNDCDVVFPKHFTVRKYDNKLNYTRHKIIRYYTSNTHTFVYCMTRSSEKVTVRIDNEGIVAMNDRLDPQNYIHFSHETPLNKLLCAMFTNKDSLVVLEDAPDNIQSPLF